MVCRQLVMLALVTALVGGLGICAAADPPPLKPHPFGKREHVVQRLNAEKEPAILPAEILWISEPWLQERTDENAQMPYLTYLPEKDRVLMLVETHQPIVTAFVFSDDHGKTWSDRQWLSTDEQGKPQGVVLGLRNTATSWRAGRATSLEKPPGFAACNRRRRFCCRTAQS